MAGVVPRKGGKYEGWYIDATGKKRRFTGTPDLAETEKTARELEAEQRKIKIRLVDADDGSEFYVDAETLSEKLLSGNGIKMSALRILELAESGYVPCDFIDGDGPYFKLGEAKVWIKTHLIQHRKAIPFPKRINVVVTEDPRKAPGGIPRELAAMADHLHEMPISNHFRSPCVYFLVKSGKVVYIGQSESLIVRAAAHLIDKEFDRVLYMFVPASEVDRVERELIRSLQPLLNGNCNPDHFAKRKQLK